MRKLLNIILVLVATFTFATNAFSFTWFFGTNAAYDYEASYDDETRILLPFTVQGTNEEMAGMHAFLGTFYKDGVLGGNGWDAADWGVDLNMGTYWGVYGDAYILDGLALTGGAARGSIADGVYTGLIDQYTGIRLGVYTEDGSEYNWLSPENNFRITVGGDTAAPVPEPSTILLLGGGLLGLGWYGRKRKKS